MVSLTSEVWRSCDVNSILVPPTLHPVPDSVRNSGKIPEEAIVDEEAILSLLENSQTFLPLSQTSNHSPLLGTVATEVHTQLQSAHFLFLLCV